MTYQLTAIIASSGVLSLAILATYFRFTWHMEADGSFPWAEMVGTLSLVFGGTPPHAVTHSRCAHALKRRYTQRHSLSISFDACGLRSVFQSPLMLLLQSLPCDSGVADGGSWHLLCTQV